MKHPEKLPQHRDIDAAQNGAHDAGQFEMKKRKTGKKELGETPKPKIDFTSIPFWVDYGRVMGPPDELSEFIRDFIFRKEVLLRPENIYDKYPAISFGNYETSVATADKAWVKMPIPLQPRLPFVPFDFPEKGDKRAIRASEEYAIVNMLYLLESGAWLKGCQGNILKAVENGDEAFFLDLARLIADRPKYRANSPIVAKYFGRSSDPKPGTRTALFRCLLVFNWVKRPLWLMSSTVACDYIRKFGRLEITPDNYNKIKNELGLEQHPKLPVVGVTDNGELVLKAGWKFPKS